MTFNSEAWHETPGRFPCPKGFTFYQHFLFLFTRFPSMLTAVYKAPSTTQLYCLRATLIGLRELTSPFNTTYAHPINMYDFSIQPLGTLAKLN